MKTGDSQPDQAYQIVPFDKSKHSVDVAEAMASGFSHDHWPFWSHSSFRFVYDVTRLMSSLCDLNFVVEERSTGKALGQIFCMAPSSKILSIKSLPLILKLITFSFLGLYFFRAVAWRHLFALRQFIPFLKKHPKNSPHFEVLLFVMHESMQGKGYGNKLMDVAINEMNNRGADKVILLTDSTMSWKFYERYGYKRAVDINLGSAYKVAMGSEREYGYVYELDVAENVAQRQGSGLN